MKKRLIIVTVGLFGALIVGLQMLSSRTSGRLVIYPAKTIITMDKNNPSASAIAIKDGTIIGLGDLPGLIASHPDAKIDRSFSDQVIVPGFIDPHIHMLLSAIHYTLPMAPPWPIATAEGDIEGYTTRDAFLARLKDLNNKTNGSKKPLIVYGYHDLVHGDLTKDDLDQVSEDRPLLIWHYSSHDFYLNSAALEWAEIDADLHETFEGVALDAEGALTGRIFEDALPYLMRKVGPKLINPLKIRKGTQGFSELLRQGGVTTVADLGYGILDFRAENLNIRFNWGSTKQSGYRLYLVPEHRAFERKFGEERISIIKSMVEGDYKTPAPVLPQVKFFADAAFYSQTMRLSPPGYLAGQSKGSEGLWVLQPEKIAETIRPYWNAGLGVRIHSNGDQAQTATLDAAATLRQTDGELNFVIEHAGLFTIDQIDRASKLDVTVSAASHYVFYLGQAYQPILGAERAAAISPLASLTNAGAPVTLHSDAPLAPPLPLRAASVHLTRATREGDILTPSEKLSRYEALEAITFDAARALGLEKEIGSIAVGKRADFTILTSNPLNTEPNKWPNIQVQGTIVDGVKYPVN